MAGSAADLDRLQMPAVPVMHAPLHHIAAAIVIVGIVIGVVRIIVIVVVAIGSVQPGAECAQRKAAAVMKSVMEAAVMVAETTVMVPETAACEGNARTRRERVRPHGGTVNDRGCSGCSDRT